MYCIKKYDGLVVSALLLFFPAPTKSEPATLLVGSACLVGGVVIGYLCSASKEKLPSPELAVQQGVHLRQQIAQEHHFLMQANAENTEDGFRSALCNYYQNQEDMSRHAQGLQSDQSSICEKLEQFQQIRDTRKKLTATQREQLEQEEGRLQKLHESLINVLRRCKNNEPYFRLYARLNSAQNVTTSAKETYPVLKKIERINSTCDQLECIESDAQRLGFKDLVSRALQIKKSLHQERSTLQNDPSFRIEKQAQLEHESRMQCESRRNRELARQAEADRVVHLQAIAQQEYRNRLRQKEIDLEEGHVRRRIENQYRSRLDQAERALRLTQGDLSKAKKALNRSLERQRKLQQDKAECARCKEELTKKLKLVLRREREQAGKDMSRQKPVSRCTVEGCIIEGCTGNHPVPSAPPYQEGERPSSPVSTSRNTAGGPPQAAVGIKR